MTRIYVASSWRNPWQQDVVRELRRERHEVYDFMHPPGGDHLGFQWSEVDPEWKSWTPEQFREGLRHPVAQAGFHSDLDALWRAEATVLVLPCNRSAHLELGYAVARGQRTAVLIADLNSWEPELMYAACGLVTASLTELTGWLAKS